MRTAKLHLSQFIETSRSYQNTATLLQYFDPTDIITPANMSETQDIIGLISVVNQCASASKVCLFSFDFECLMYPHRVSTFIKSFMFNDMHGRHYDI